MGTTRDYVARIREKMPGRAFFLTDPSAVSPGTLFIPPDEELICPLADGIGVTDRLLFHLQSEAITLSGITCFDCEWLPLAASLADRLGLPFPPGEAVLNCRDKFLSKKLWMENGVSCPQVRPVFALGDILAFMREIGSPVVLKPRIGSGSALTFRCETEAEAGLCYAEIVNGLKARADEPLFQNMVSGTPQGVLCEEWIRGDEFSCDFLVDGPQLKVLRTARKYYSTDLPLGTALAYEIPARLPEEVDDTAFKEQLWRAAHILGLERGLGMADFLYIKGALRFLELTPRLGGDCLPWLIKESCGLDMLQFALDFSEGGSPVAPPSEGWERLIGVRIHAGRSGRLKTVRPCFREHGVTVRSQLWIRRPGDYIQMPPEDYGSWLLGHVIFQPDTSADIPAQIQDLLRAVEVDIT